ncbi:MAG: exosortase/archaeosortase family protein [Zavarzinella sp.]
MNHLKRIPASAWLLVIALVWTYFPALTQLLNKYLNDPQYSHGILVPFFALFLWMRRPIDATAAVKPWPIVGGTLLVGALSMHLLATAISFLTLNALSILLSVLALIMIYRGKSGIRQSWPALIFLLFMVPMPYQSERILGAELQNIGTICTTLLLQCFGQPAIRDGNLILIGEVRLGVVEACSGLRMMVTFAAFCVAAVLVLERHWVHKLLILLSCVPIALLVNILRITATGLCHIWLKDSASKTKVMDFLHDFNGWMMMPVGLAFLLLELWVLKHLLVEKPVKATPIQRDTNEQRRPLHRGPSILLSRSAS